MSQYEPRSAWANIRRLPSPSEGCTASAFNYHDDCLRKLKERWSILLHQEPGGRWRETEVWVRIFFFLNHHTSSTFAPTFTRRCFSTNWVLWMVIFGSWGWVSPVIPHLVQNQLPNVIDMLNIYWGSILGITFFLFSVRRFRALPTNKIWAFAVSVLGLYLTICTGAQFCHYQSLPSSTVCIDSNG